jgi:hypothetical protein
LTGGRPGRSAGEQSVTREVARWVQKRENAMAPACCGKRARNVWEAERRREWRRWEGVGG